MRINIMAAAATAACMAAVPASAATRLDFTSTAPVSASFLVDLGDRGFGSAIDQSDFTSCRVQGGTCDYGVVIVGNGQSSISLVYDLGGNRDGATYRFAEDLSVAGTYQTIAGSTGTGFVTVSNVPGPGTVGSVPEPATWAMMILGCGAIGGSLRSRKVRYQAA